MYVHLQPLYLSLISGTVFSHIPCYYLYPVWHTIMYHPVLFTCPILWSSPVPCCCSYVWLLYRLFINTLNTYPLLLSLMTYQYDMHISIPYVIPSHPVCFLFNDFFMTCFCPCNILIFITFILLLDITPICTGYSDTHILPTFRIWMNNLHE